jgi:hypothetical protein
MARIVYRWNPETGEWTEADRRIPSARLGIVTDTIDPLEHPCDGRLYDSKSAFRRTTKAHGCEEVGPHKPQVRDYEPRGIKDDIARVLRGEYKRD